MALLLGVDTGGTYTDAVLIRDDEAVIASAKSLTTRHDLAIGVGGAVRAVLAEAAISPEEVSMASLSTTLATNALVEGQGGRVALIYIGFKESDLTAHGLAEALKGDPYVVLAGGHNHAGGEARKLDEEALIAFLELIRTMSVALLSPVNLPRVTRRMNCARPRWLPRSLAGPYHRHINCPRN